MRFWWLCTDELQWPVICTVIKDLSSSLRRKHKSHLQRCRRESVKHSTFLQPNTLTSNKVWTPTFITKTFLQANEMYNGSILCSAMNGKVNLI